MNRAVWINAVLGERRSWVIGWSIAALLLFVLAALFFFAVSAGEPKKQLIGGTVPLALLALFYWMRYVPGAMRQNSPVNARLVPGLHRAVRRTTVLVWCLTLAPLAVFASAFEHATLMFVVLSAMVTSLGMSRGGSAIGAAIYILLIVAMAFSANMPTVVAWLSTAPALAALFVLSAGLAWGALRAIFPFGGERHWKLLPAQAMQRGSADLQRVMRSRRAAAWRLWPYRRLLRRDLRLSTRPEHLLLHALGPGNHRFDFVHYLLQMLLVGIVAKLTVLGLGAAKVPLGGVVMFFVVIIAVQGLNFHRLVVSMRNTRGEQALVRLAPRAPRADQLGAVVARQMLKICVFEWLACGACALAVMLLCGAGVKELVTLAMLQCAALAMVGWPLRDYSGRTRGRLPVMIAQVVLVAGLALGLYMARDQPALWIALPGCALAIVYHRWKTMAGAAPPFPASATA